MMQTFYEHLQEDNSSLDSIGHDMPMSSKRKKQLEADKGVFEDFATLGVQCSVLPGVTLREGTIVGANSLITSDTEPWTIYGGSPAKPIGKRDSEKALQYAKELGY